MKPILVVGDLIIDAYHHGRLGGTAPDFPTILGHKDSTRLSYGGAGFVVSNLLAHERQVIFLTLIGSGLYSEYANAYQHEKLTKIFLEDVTRPMTVKERFWIGGHKLLEWHHFDDAPITSPRERELLMYIKKQLPLVDKVLVADYRHGLISERVAESIVRLCKEAKVPLYVDSQVVHARANQLWYKGATLFLLNAKEAKEVDPSFNRQKVRSSLVRLKNILKAKHVVVKLDAEGSAALLDTTFIRTPSYPVQAIDPVGAGDAFVAALALGKTPPTRRDLEIANIWAALTTTNIGMVTPPLSEFQDHLLKRRSRN